MITCCLLEAQGPTRRLWFPLASRPILFSTRPQLCLGDIEVQDGPGFRCGVSPWRPVLWQTPPPWRTTTITNPTRSAIFSPPCYPAETAISNWLLWSASREDSWGLTQGSFTRTDPDQRAHCGLWHTQGMMSTYLRCSFAPHLRSHPHTALRAPAQIIGCFHFGFTLSTSGCSPKMPSVARLPLYILGLDTICAVPGSVVGSPHSLLSPPHCLHELGSGRE